MVIIMKNTKQAIFQLGDESYGLDIMEVNTIEKFITVEQVSNSPKNMKGIIRLRGDIIPVYSLRRKFGLEDKEPDDESRYIITTS
ncbi:MAG TPA: chemotaxis protein CheW, partial [Mobilitalea sp.]|nr:chemotaxis protein CheW [Mobilitalea sp.]